jgi:hypothetical protein
MHWKKQIPPYGTLKMGRKFCILPETWGDHRVWLKSIPTISCYTRAKYDFGSIGEDCWTECSLRDYLDALVEYLTISYNIRVALGPEERIKQTMLSLSQRIPNYNDFFIINMSVDQESRIKVDIKVTDRRCSTKEQLIWSLRNPIEIIPIGF